MVPRPEYLCLIPFSSSLVHLWNVMHLTSSDTLTSETIMQAERSLWRVRQDIANKEAEPSTERRSSWRNVFIGSASSELAGLKAMERQAAQALAGMKQRMSRQVFAQTFGGKVFNVVGKVFGVYCAARVLMVCLFSGQR